ncbi:MAG: hypothetical protein IH788_02095 [Nitrospinae bacterium]|nr:hypothetical protein [Nitrospinota bacterium]
MRLTIARKLLLGFGSLLAIFLITGLVVNANIRTIEKDLTEITMVEEPTSAAAYEMEINVIGTGLGLSIHAENGLEGGAAFVVRLGLDEA